VSSLVGLEFPKISSLFDSGTLWSDHM